MLKVASLSKEIHEYKVLEKISFFVAAGEKLSIIGPGGCGKTLLIKTILGLELPSAGKVTIFGKNIHDITERNRLHLLRRVGLALQHIALFDFMSVKDNLMFPMEHMPGMKNEGMLDKVISALSELNLSQTLNMYPQELSGGMKRRVGILRAMITDPDLLIFDDPTAGLDPINSAAILDILNRIAQPELKACIISTTNVEIAMKFASRVIIMREGHIIGDGNWRELLMNGDTWTKSFLSSRIVGLDLEYVKHLGLPDKFLARHWY